MSLQYPPGSWPVLRTLGPPEPGVTTEEANDTHFPTMGMIAAKTVANVSGAPSANTKFVARKSGKSDAPVGRSAIRKQTLERGGFKGAPQVGMVYPQAPEAKNQARMVRLVPSAIGNRDFYSRREYGQRV